MKKVQIAILLVILAVVAVAVSLAGCSKSQGGAGTSSQSSGFSVKNYETQLDVSLSPLVQDGTITAAQEDKILAAYATLMSSRTKFTGSRPSGMNGSRPSGGYSRPSGMTGSRPSGYSGSYTSGMNSANSPLSKLVTAKTITQAQADAVTKALSASGAGFGGAGFGGGGFGGGGYGGYGRNRQSGQTTES